MEVVAENLRQEIEHLKQMMWAMVRAAGGRITVPYNIWTGANRTVELEMWEDAEKEAIIVRAVDYEPEQKEV